MRSIIRLTDPDTKEEWFFQWVGSCDSVLLPGMTLEELLLEIEDDILSESGAHWLRKGSSLSEYAPGLKYPSPKDFGIGPEAAEAIERRVAYLTEEARMKVERIKARGHSFFDDNRTPEECVRFNRNGPKEGSLSVKGILRESAKLRRKGND